MADPARIDEAVSMLAAARQPLIVAGGGVHLSGACAELAALQEDCHIPVMTTVMGKGTVDERHPLSLGVTGYVLGKLSPARHMKPIIDDADVILLVGTRTNQNGTDSWKLYPKTARFIHIDIDGGEIGRNYDSMRLAGDAKLTLAALREKLVGARRPIAGLAARIAEAKARHAVEIAPLETSNASPIRPERLAADIRQVLTPETIVVADASYSTIWVACFLQSLKAGMRFITPRGKAK